MERKKRGWFFYFFLIPNPSVESRADFIILGESLFLPPVNSREGERKECRMKAEES